MKIYISSDLEGVNGVVYPHQTFPEGGLGYQKAIRQQALELNVIVDALFNNGAEQVTINDAHGAMENLSVVDFSNHRNVEIITGKPRDYSMVNGLDSTYDGVILHGYHSRAGSIKGVLAHTFSLVFTEVRLNGRPIGELELNSIYAGILGVPVIMGTGDNITCNQLKDTVQDAVCVCVKTAVSFSSAVCKSNEEVFSLLTTGVRESVSLTIDDVPVEVSPYVLEVFFKDNTHAEIAKLLPCVRRTSAYSVEYVSENYLDVYKMLQFFSAVFK